jgi:ribosome-associated translation inhibitor RaiA
MARVIPPPMLYGVERKRVARVWTYTFKDGHATINVTFEGNMNHRARVHLDMKNPSVEQLKAQTNWYCDIDQDSLNATLETVIEALRQHLQENIKRTEDMAERCLIHARRHRRNLEQLGGPVDPPTLWERLDGEP